MCVTQGMPRPSLVKKSTNYLSSPTFLVGGSLLVIFLGWMALNEYFRERAIDAEVQKLKVAIADVEQKNKDLHSSLSYLQTNDFQELEAKRQLGVAKEGEKVIVFTNKSLAIKSSDNSAGGDGNQSDQSNPQKWWKYFFEP